MRRVLRLPCIADRRECAGKIIIVRNLYHRRAQAARIFGDERKT